MNIGLKDLDDLSFSGIVGIINNDENIGKEFIDFVFQEIEMENVKLLEAEKIVENTGSRIRSLENSIDLVIKHLEWKKPLYLNIENKKILEIKQQGITEIKNIK